ncbi:MAG: type II toxin-antitoxin system RelE family toxin [Candidatus Nanoarchaeia archaeon]
MYKDEYSLKITKELSMLKKKDKKQYELLRKMMDKILANPESNYKFLHYDLKGFQRIHTGHFVLIFVVNHQNKTVSFEDYKHHDQIYK